MKPCPNCKSEAKENPPSVYDGMSGKWVYCHNCQMTGPLAKTAAEAIAAWDALPRKLYYVEPVNSLITLSVGETEYTIAFVHIKATTICNITWMNKQGRLRGVGGASYCNPKDTFSAEIGEKVAMRKACGIEEPWGIIGLSELYHEYRLYIRDAVVQS